MLFLLIFFAALKWIGALLTTNRELLPRVSTWNLAVYGALNRSGNCSGQHKHCCSKIVPIYIYWSRYGTLLKNSWCAFGTFRARWQSCGPRAQRCHKGVKTACLPNVQHYLSMLRCQMLAKFATTVRSFYRHPFVKLMGLTIHRENSVLIYLIHIVEGDIHFDL